MYTLFLSLIPAVLWGVNPTILGKIGGKPIQQQFGITFTALIFAGTVTLIMRPQITPAVAGAGFVSGLFWALAMLMMFKSFQIIGTSTAYPISVGLNLVFNCLFGVIVFGEWDTKEKVGLGFCALAVIICGVALTTYQEEKDKSKIRQGILVLLVSAVGFMFYSCAPSFANVSGVQTLLPQAIGGLCGLLLLSIYEARDTKIFAPVTAKCMLPGVTWSFANLALIYANRINGVAIGYTLSQACVVVSTICSLLFLDEKKTKRELRHIIVGVILVMTGCVGIGLTKM